MRRSRPVVVLLLLAALPLAACGDDDDTPIAEAGDCETVTVEIGEFTFDPTPVEIDACDSVVWTNAHDQAHTATGSGAASWDTGSLAAGSSSEPVPFDEPGEHPYICALHPFMQGAVSVT